MEGLGEETKLLVMGWDRTLGGDCGARGFLVKLGSESGKRPPVESDHQSLGSVWLAPSVFLSFRNLWALSIESFFLKRESDLHVGFPHN
jgi:hypothetical protein